jgi:cellobiose phosphorylase
VHDEVVRNRVVTRGPGKGDNVEGTDGRHAKGQRTCPKLLSWPFCCNGCSYRRLRCSYGWRCEYLADDAQAQAAMEQVWNRLNTAYGAVLMDPPFHAHAFAGALATIFNQGVKENAGIFSQSQGWVILAEALLGHGERAFAYFSENAPAMQNDRAEVRCIEPYCYGQFTEGPASLHFGRSHVHWLTGTASTIMVGCVEGILGMRPDLGGIRIAPAIPKDWKALTIEKAFRGRMLHIRIENPEGRESGCKSMTVNGAAVSGNYIPEAMLTEETEIVLVM